MKHGTSRPSMKTEVLNSFSQNMSGTRKRRHQYWRNNRSTQNHELSVALLFSTLQFAIDKSNIFMSIWKFHLLTKWGPNFRLNNAVDFWVWKWSHSIWTSHLFSCIGLTFQVTYAFWDMVYAFSWRLRSGCSIAFSCITENSVKWFL